MTNIWHHWPGIDEEVAAIFDPFGNAVHTALTFPVIGEDVLVTGAGPIGCMAVAVARHAGARHIVASDPNPYRRTGSRCRWGRPRRSTRPPSGLKKTIQGRARDDGGLRRHPSRCRVSRPHCVACCRWMAHGGRIALLGIQTGEVPIDFTPIVFNMLTLKGIYGREMYETWYQMSVLVQAGLDIKPVITHGSPIATSRKRGTVAASGESGKVILDWTNPLGREGAVYGTLQQELVEELDELREARLYKGELRSSSRRRWRTSRWRGRAACSTSAPTTTRSRQPPGRHRGCPRSA